MSEEMRASFEEWLEREIPAGTVIGDPKWWAPRILKAALQQESEAVAVKAFRHKDTNEIRYALSTPPHDETEWEDVYISTAPQQDGEAGVIGDMRENGVTWHGKNPHAFPVGTKFYTSPPSAPAIEAAAYMRAAEEVFRHVESDDDANAAHDAIVALIPQDGRTQLEEFGWQLAQAILEARREGLLDGSDIRAIVNQVMKEVGN